MYCDKICLRLTKPFRQTRLRQFELYQIQTIILVVRREEAAQIAARNCAERIALFASAAMFRRREFVTQALQRHALQDYAARTGQRCQK